MRRLPINTSRVLLFVSFISTVSSSDPIASLAEFGASEGGGPSVDAAQELLQLAREGLSSAQKFCSEPGTCDASFLDSLGRLQARADALEQALSQGPSAIDYAIQQLDPVLHEVCSVLGGGACTGLPFGAVVEKGPSTGPAKICGICACQDSCWQQYSDCLKIPFGNYLACNSQWTQFIRCWQILPYPGDPFPPWLRDEFNQKCQQFVQAGRLPAFRCATCPQEERKGGCPDFFVTGQLCDQCTYMRCEDNPGIVCSCSKPAGTEPGSWNFTQCDTCRWYNLGYGLGNLSKGTFCTRPWYSESNNCLAAVNVCLQSCH
jgi:hypothetical protein